MRNNTLGCRSIFLSWRILRILDPATFHLDFALAVGRPKLRLLRCSLSDKGNFNAGWREPGKFLKYIRIEGFGFKQKSSRAYGSPRMSQEMWINESDPFWLEAIFRIIRGFSVWGVLKNLGKILILEFWVLVWKKFAFNFFEFYKLTLIILIRYGIYRYKFYEIKFSDFQAFECDFFRLFGNPTLPSLLPFDQFLPKLVLLTLHFSKSQIIENRRC